MYLYCDCIEHPWKYHAWALFQFTHTKLVLTSSFIFLIQTTSAASYSKFVSREMSKAEALLKVCDLITDGFVLWPVKSFILNLNFCFNLQVILSPVDSVADTYRALLPEGTPMEFQRILELKVTVYNHTLLFFLNI